MTSFASSFILIPDSSTKAFNKVFVSTKPPLPATDSNLFADQMFLPKFDKIKVIFENVRQNP